MTKNSREASPEPKFTKYTLKILGPAPDPEVYTLELAGGGYKRK